MSKYKKRDGGNVVIEQYLGDLESIAKSVGFIERESEHFSAEGFLRSLFRSLEDGKASFRKLASRMATINNNSLSKQALWKRIKKDSCPDFLQAVLDKVNGQQTPENLSPRNSKCKRLIVQDSTQIRSHKKNHKHYAGTSNKSTRTSCAKIDLTMNFLTNDILLIQESNGKEQDRTLGRNLLPLLDKGDMKIRDLGYSSLESFKYAEGIEALWMSRLHGQMKVSLEDGNTLESLLSTTLKSTLDIPVRITAEGHTCRLVAVRCSKETVDRRRAKRKEKGDAKRRKRRSNGDLREQWSLYITNIPEEQLSTHEVISFYEQRWAIEITFRALKGASNMQKAMRSPTNKNHLQLILKAAQILALLTSKVQAVVAAHHSIERCKLSIEKFMDWMLSCLSQLDSMNIAYPYRLRELSHEVRIKRKTLAQRRIGHLKCLG